MEDHDGPHNAKDLVLDAASSNAQREENDILDDIFDPVDLIELVGLSERPRYVPPSKRRPTWL